jgi:hypothetical protein
MSEKTYSETFDRTTADWRISSRSNDGGEARVEVAELPDGGWAVRDSKDPDGPILFFTPAEREAFVLGVKDGEFDL